MKLDKALRNKPQVVSLEVTYRCNLNCIYCKKRDQGESHKDLSDEMLKKLKEVIVQQKKVIICGIGESFLYPKLYELIHEFPKQKFCIVTNGTIPINFSKLNIYGNVEQIIYSIDAAEQDILNKISGKYNMDHLLSNLMEYHTYYQSQNGCILQVLNCTLNEYNLGQITQLVHFAYEYHMDTIHFSLPRGKEGFIQEHQKEIIESLNEAKKIANHYGIYFVNPFDVCCVYLRWVTPYITLDGDIFACAEDLYVDHKLGNLADITLKEAFESKAYEEFQSGKRCETCRFLQNSKLSFS